MQRPRARSRSDLRPIVRTHPIGTPRSGLSPNTGPLAAAAWLVGRDLFPSHPRWFVDVTFDAKPTAAAVRAPSPTRFQLEIYAEEWGYSFCHQGSSSWIRVTDIAFVHGKDDLGLLGETPALRDIGRLIKKLEARFAVAFVRSNPLVRTSLVDALPVITEWAKSL